MAGLQQPGHGSSVRARARDLPRDGARFAQCHRHSEDLTAGTAGRGNDRRAGQGEMRGGAVAGRGLK